MKIKENGNMNDKQFTDELFKRMYDLGYKKAEMKTERYSFTKTVNVFRNGQIELI